MVVSQPLHLPMTDLSDAALIERSKVEPEVFAVLFDRHAQAIYRYLARRVAEMADDLLSETFLIAFRQRGRYRPERVDVRPWLYGIATNLLRNHARAERRRYNALARLPGADLVSSLFEDEASERMDAESLRAELAAALGELKPPDRDALLLVAWAQLSYAEVAAALDIPIGTVRSRLNRARRLMRGALALPDRALLETP